MSAWLTGESEVEGQVTVELEADDDSASFLVTLVGSAESTTVSSARSIRIYGGASSTFRATKRVLFDGVEYHGEPTSVELQTRSRVRSIRSTRRGLVGRLAVSVAQRQLPRLRPQAQRIADRDNRRMLRREFDQLADELIVELNKTTPVEETIMRLFPETQTWVYNLSTTDDYIQASAGPKGMQFPELPRRSGADPVELWLRTGDGAVKPEVLAFWNVAQDLLREAIPEDTELPQPLRGDATADQVGEWTVISIGT